MKTKFRISYRTVFVASLILVFGMLIWYFSEDIVSIFRGEVSIKEVFPILSTSDQSSVPTISNNRDSESDQQKVSTADAQTADSDLSPEEQTIQFLTEFAKNSGVLDDTALSSLQTLVDFQGLRDPFENLLTTSESKPKNNPTNTPTNNTTINTKTDKNIGETEAINSQQSPDLTSKKTVNDSVVSLESVIVEDKGLVSDQRLAGQNTTYEELLQQLTGEQTIESPNIAPVEQEIVYPPFVLKGIASQANKIRAIIQYQANSLIIEGGQQIEDWTIQEVNSGQVVITNMQNQCFILTLEGVILDEED